MTNEKLFKDVARVIEVERMVEGLSGAELAKRCGKSKHFYKRLRGGKRNLTLKDLNEVAIKLGKRVRVVLEDDVK